MSAPYAIVWLDHHTAHVITFARTGGSSCDVIASGSPRQLHRKSGVVGAGHAAPDHGFFDEVADALVGVDEVILCGPGGAKVALDRYLGRRRRSIARHVVGVETTDHPSDGQLLEHARVAFRRLDQLEGR